MKKFYQTDLVSEEAGAAFPSALIIITIISVLAVIIMSGIVIQNRFIQRDIDAVQARYTAEGAIFRFLADDEAILTDSTEVMLPDSRWAVVQSEPFGGFLKITSEAQAGTQNSRIRVLAGRRPHPAFENAVVIGDIHSRLNLAGNTNITGDILAGPLGLRESAFRGRPYTGNLQGEIHTSGSTPLPAYDGRFYKDEAERYRKLLQETPAGAKVLAPGRYDAVELLSGSGTGQVIFASGDLEIVSSVQTELPGSLTVVAAGNISLEGDVRYSPFTRMVSGKKLTIGGNVKGTHGLFIAEEILMNGQINGSGQFIAKKEIRLADSAWLRYPSVIFLEGVIEGTTRTGRIELAGASVVDGIVMFPPPETVVTEERGRIVIGETARLRGALYNTAQSELHGNVLGSVLTFQFYLYHSPTTYINWMMDHSIDISKRPDPFTVPLGFGDDDELFDILDWQEL